MSSRKTRFIALGVLALLAWWAPQAAADDQSQCFSQCSVMEEGCEEVGGELQGSCSYNPYVHENDRCKLPGCWCPQKEDGICTEDI